MMSDPSISFYTLGCRLNQAETAVIRNTFSVHGGYRIVERFHPSDIVVVNTCTVTENSDADTRRLVNRLVRLNPRVRIALIGCQAQVQKAQLTGLKNVRWVVGNADKMNLATILGRHPDEEKPAVLVSPVTREPFSMPAAGIDHRHTRANLKIQDGCDFFCSFCEIPYARGRARSRRFDDILREAETLAAAGHQEIVITGINVGTYRYEGKNIVDVVSGLEDISRLRRIRISSIEPTTIPEALLGRMWPRGKLCRHLHVPMQNAHDEILKRMNRKYAAAAYFDFIQKAVDAVPGLCVGSDVMVGFPGETDDHFEENYRRITEAPIHYLHVFSYSRRSLARSRDMAGHLPAADIHERSAVLRKLGRAKRRAFYEAAVGRRHTVLFEQRKDGFWNGLTDNFIRVKMRSDENLANRLVDVEIREVSEQGVFGKIAS